MTVDLVDFPSTPDAWIRMPLRADFYFPFDGTNYNRSVTSEVIAYALTSKPVNMYLEMQRYSYVNSIASETITEDERFEALPSGDGVSAIQSILWPTGVTIEYDPSLSVVFNLFVLLGCYHCRMQAF
jgi:hypothetical protein